jgi:hypothetical protein
MKNPNAKRKLRAVLIAVFVSGFLLAFFAWTAGCEMFANHTNPIAGWQKDFSPPGPSDKIIEKDYQDYIQKLPPEERKYVGGTNFFKDGTGQHAVEIEVDLNGTAWNHVLIYDKNNKRIKVIKYVAWHYMS